MSSSPATARTTTRRDQHLGKEAQSFLERKSAFHQRAPAHAPSLEEIQQKSFQDYVRQVLFEQEQQETEGILKVTLPDGFMQHSEDNGIAADYDTTARGPNWQQGTTLGDMMVRGPIEQNVSGLGGVYEYTLIDQKALSLHEFRTKADAYRKQQIGSVEPENDWSDEVCDSLSQVFWKRLGPTMASSMYGADMEGSLFQEGDDACGWNLQTLDSCLQVLTVDTEGENLPGVTTPYLYFGMWASVFCAHTEDMNLLSINYLHAGAPKYWYAIAQKDAKRFESLCESRFVHARNECGEFLRHKRYLISPHILKKAGIPFKTQIQRPGDAVITYPGAYHFGLNLGFNVAEATNFATPEWIPIGKQASVCMCRPYAVRIDMDRFQDLMEMYEKDMQRREGKGGSRISYRQWTKEKVKRSPSKKNVNHSTPKPKNDKGQYYLTSEEVVEDQLMANKKKNFVIEVTRPVSSSSSSTPKKKKRKRKAVDDAEEWRTAMPPSVSKLNVVGTKVLVLLPGKEVDSGEDEEQCFLGQVTEVADGCVRVHFQGLSKQEDVWMAHDSPKIFLDGGRVYYD